VANLEAADADGADVRLRQRSVSINMARGPSVLFDTDDELDFVAPLAGGAPVPPGTQDRVGRGLRDGSPG